MEYRFKPEGVCSREMAVEIENGIIKKAEIVGGCAGNTVGLSNLLVGMTLEEAIKRLKAFHVVIEELLAQTRWLKDWKKFRKK